MLKHLFNFCKNLSSRIKQWTKPIGYKLRVGKFCQIQDFTQ
jgi:hypothetical protein